MPVPPFSPKRSGVLITSGFPIPHHSGLSLIRALTPFPCQFHLPAGALPKRHLRCTLLPTPASSFTLTQKLLSYRHYETLSFREPFLIGVKGQKLGRP